jgi:hypothetical protein
MSESATVRSVTVRLNAEIAKYVTDVRTAGRETDKAFSGVNDRLAVTDDRLGTVSSGFDRVATSERKVTAETRRVDTSASNLNRSLDKSSRSIDKFSGRLALVAHVGATVAPALVPIGAVAVPAVTALASELGFAAVGAGTAMLAFHGLGDALNKFNKAEAEPTATNIAAAQQAMDKIPPSAQAFVLELHRLNPELDKLRQSAGAGLFDGLSAGLHAASTDLPLVRNLVGDVSTELGVLGREAGQSLASSRWRPFLRFVDNEAPQALDHMGHAVGATTHGLAELWMAFAPVNRDIDSGILALARDFDQWATSLGRTKDFQSFLAYVDANGPKVVQLLGNTRDLFVDIVQAAAPLGGPTLDALNLIVQALDLIASSPIATPLLALAQVNSILKLTSRGLQGLGVDAAIGIGGVTKSSRTAKTELSGLQVQAKSAGTALRTIGGNVRRYTTSGTTLLAGVKREDLANLGKATALVGGLAVASTGAGEALGLQNTIMLAAAGSVIPGYGTAIGGAVGLALDWKASLDKDAESVKALRDQVSQLAAEGNVIALSKLADQGERVSDFAASKGGIFSGLQEGANIPTSAFDTISGSILQFNSALNGTSNPIYTLQKMQTVATRMQPAMAKLGLTFDDLLNMDPTELKATVDHLSRMTVRADAAQGSVHSVARAFADMSDEALTADQRIANLQSSLSALLDPKLNLSQLSDQFAQGLNDLRKNLTGTSLTARNAAGRLTDAAIANRAAIHQQVTTIEGLINAQAKAGVPADQMTGALRRNRRAILDAGAAAGLSKRELETYLDSLGLTPKFVETAIRLVGATQASSVVSHLRGQLEGLNGRVFSTTIRVTREGSALISTGGKTITTPAGADGMTVPGQRHPYGDKVLIHAAPGEEIITNRHGEADQFRADRAAGRIPAYAGGGTVDTHVTSTPAGLYMRSPELAREMTGVRGHLHQLSTALAAATKVLDQERQSRQNLVANEKQLAASVRDQFRTDLFADQGSVWDSNGGFNPLGTLQTDIGDARQFRGLLRSLHRRGVGGQLLAQLAQSGSITDAQQLASMSGGRLRDIEHAFRVRQRLTADVGQFAGMAVFGDRIAEQTQIVRHQAADVAALRREQHEANRRLGQIEKAVHKNAKDTAKELNTKGSQAARRVAR